MYTTKAVIETLGVPERTLRYWSTAFESHMSPGARPAKSNSGSTHRRYNDADLVVLKRVKTLAGSGLRLAEIESVLRGDRKPTTLGAARRGSRGLANAGSSDLIEQVAAAAQQQQAYLAKLSEQTMRQFDEMAARIHELERRLERAESRPAPLDIELTTPVGADLAGRRFGWFHGKPAAPRRPADAVRRNTIRLMARRGWTPEDLAFYASITPESVHRLVAGGHAEGQQAPDTLVRALAKAFEVDPASLFEASA